MTWSRRAFLRSAAATVALPYLPSLIRDARAEADAFPTRLLFFYVPNGFRMDLWRPSGEGTDFTFGATMASLEAFKDDVLVVTGLDNASGRSDRPGDHARGTGGFLTCTPMAFDAVDNGISVDQVAAGFNGADTPYRSLELGSEGGASVGTCDSGYPCAYTRNVSWAGPATPLPKLTNPKLVFDRLFAGSDTGRTRAEQERRAVYRSSVLDVVRDQASSMKGRLDSDDKHRLDEYLTGVRELERRLGSLSVCAPSYEPPYEVVVQDHADAMMDLAVAALACDYSRYVTYMLGNAGSNRTYGFLDGVRGAHHQLSHHQNEQSNLDQLAPIDRWEVERFARLLGKLQEATEGGGSLLDHTMVVFGSEISDGNRHNHDDLPVIVAGKGNGAVGTGRHLVVPDRTPVANLYTSMLHAVGMPGDTTFADATGPLTGLAG